MRALLLLAVFASLFLSAGSAEAAVYTCSSCSACSSRIAAANPGDIIQLTADISATGTCVRFGGKDNVTFDCQWNTITGDGVGSDYGIWLNQSAGGSNYNTIRNCVFTNWSTASGWSRIIFLESSSNNKIENILAVYNKEAISLRSGSNNNTFTNITISNFTNDAIYMSYSHNNTFTNLNISYANLVMSEGISIDDTSSYNTVANATILKINFGIHLFNSTSHNTIRDCRIENSGDYGIFLQAAPGYNQCNILYNNYLNNSVNLYSDNANNINYWNTTLDCTRTNIINGPCIGGNYWTDPNGNFSDSCADSDLDGICDSSYAPQANNVDYLPLSSVIFICDSCASCSAMIAAASPGDIIRLTADINNYAGINDGTDPGESCIQFGGKDNITFDCSGHTIDGDGDNWGNGIWLNYSNGGSHNNTVRECIVRDFGDGISLNRSSKNTIKDMVAYGNWHGLGIYEASNNTIINLSAYSNDDEGITIDRSSNYNILTKMNLSYNGGAGMIGGIHLDGSSYNTINDSRIEGNAPYGIFVDRAYVGGWVYSTYNRIYNNYLNNTVSMYSEWGSNLNYWNATKAAGTNIIGGPYIAGNYWTDPVGGNFSDTCADADGDGICDSPYSPAASNVDYLPLAAAPLPALPVDLAMFLVGSLHIHVGESYLANLQVRNPHPGLANISVWLGGDYPAEMARFASRPGVQFSADMRNAMASLNPGEETDLSVWISSAETRGAGYTLAAYSNTTFDPTIGDSDSISVFVDYTPSFSGPGFLYSLLLIMGAAGIFIFWKVRRA